MDHMTTCTQRATSHKCSILFSNNTLRPVSSHFGPLWSGLGANFGLRWICFRATLEHVEDTGAEVNSLSVQSRCYFLLMTLHFVFFRQRTINFLLIKTNIYIICNLKWIEIWLKKKKRTILNWLTWKWIDPHPGKASMRMALAGWSELKMCFVLKKVYCIFKNNNN